jgi:hypothetical protein
LLGIHREVGHRLALMPEAAELLSSLRLPRGETVLYAACESGTKARTPPGVISVLRLSAQSGARERLSYARAKLFPHADLLRDRYPFARRGGADAYTRVAIRVLHSRGAGRAMGLAPGASARADGPSPMGLIPKLCEAHRGPAPRWRDRRGAGGPAICPAPSTSTAEGVGRTANAEAKARGSATRRLGRPDARGERQIGL